MAGVVTCTNGLRPFNCSPKLLAKIRSHQTELEN